jgi:predicted  nucleic acid-binding Zn-ribbon protein
VELEARAEKVEAEVERLRGEVERVEGARARAAQSGLAMVEKAEREVERLRSALDTANATNRELLSKRDGHLAALARAREVLRGLVDLYGSAGTDQIRAAMKVLEEDP